MNLKIKSWLEENWHKAEGINFATIHLDIPKNIGSSQLTIWALEIYQEALNHLISCNKTKKLVLVIPLQVLGNQLSQQFPTSQELLNTEISLEEPPTLYLLSNDFYSYKFCDEEYKVLLPFLLKDTPDILAYYREFRSPEAQAKAWEYSRCVYIEYFPKPYNL
jgi:hypothetical protein